MHNSRNRGYIAGLLVVLNCVFSTLAATTSRAHHDEYAPRLLAENTAPTNETSALPANEAEHTHDVAELDRQVAFFECEMLLHLALHAPTPLQQEVIDLAFADHRLATKAPGRLNVGELQQYREEVQRELRRDYRVLPIRWTETEATISDITPVELASGLGRHILLEISNDTEGVIDISGRQVGNAEAAQTKYTIHAGRKLFLPIEVVCHSLSQKTLGVELVCHGDPTHKRHLEIPITVTQPAILKGKLHDAGRSDLWPGRVYVLGGDRMYRHGESYADNETLSTKQLLQFWDLGRYYKLPFFYSDGAFEVKVPAGMTEVSLERGFEHRIETRRIDLQPGEVREIELSSSRLVDMQQLGWISGDTHVHWVTNKWNVDMSLQLLATIQRAEDLRVANNLTLLQRGPSLAFINPSQAPMGTVEEFSDGQYHIEMGEEYRNEDLYGHLCFLNLDWLVQPIGTGSIIAGPDALDYPINKTAILACREQGGISCEAHGLGGNKDVPVNVVHGLTDSLDQIRPNNYYDFLDCGFHLPLTNGSDHPARVMGCARAYVKVDGDFTYEKWIEGIRQCRTFTTSGPLIFLSVNDADIGETLSVNATEELHVRARVVSRKPIGNFQIVSNGEILKETRVGANEAELEIVMPAGESRWIVARCSPTDNFSAIEQTGVAHTSAVYVDVDGTPRFVAAKAKRWISELRKHIRDIRGKGRFANDMQMQEAIGYVKEGIRRYSKLIDEGKATKSQSSRRTTPRFQLVSKSRPASSKKILLIPTKLDHPWATHMYRQGCELLAACLNRTNGVKAVVSPDFDWPRDPALLEDVSAIVFYSRPAADIVFDPSRREEFQRLMNSGVGFAAIHWATGTIDDKYGPEYLDLLGGWFSTAHSGLKIDKRMLQQVLPDHPLCRGWQPFELRDEFYLNLQFAENAQPLLNVNVDGEDQTVAWVFERPDSNGGRSFGTTLAHFHDNFAIPAFRKAIVNGILWTAHAEVPADGAGVEPKPPQVTLPDEPPEETKSEESSWPLTYEVETQPLLVQINRLVEALDYIGNPLPESTKVRLKKLQDERDASRVGEMVQELLDPHCLAAVDIDEGKLLAVPQEGEHEVVQQGWRSYLVKVCNRTGLTGRLCVESPNARSLPHSKQEDVASRWLGLAMFDGRPLQPNLSGLELEYRVLQLYSRDQGKKQAALEFFIDAEPGKRGRQIREWRFDRDADGWNAMNHVKLDVRDGSLVATSTGLDPYIGTEVGGVTGDLILRFWAESNEDGIGQIHWWTEEQPSADPLRVVNFPLLPGASRLYELELPVKGVLAGVRIDTNMKPGQMRFDWIDLCYAHRQGETWNSVPLRFNALPSVPVKLRITDKPGEPAAAAFDIRDHLGRVYPEQTKRLAPDFFFHPQVYRMDGETMHLPPGRFSIRCWRGPHSIPETKTLVVGNEPTEFSYQVQRWVDPAKFGWWSGDHHIHAAGCLHYQNPTEGVLPKDMLRQTMGEDLNVGCCLTWGPCFDYQKQFFTGDVHVASQYPYLIRYDIEVSGFGSHASGHLNLLRLTEQIYPGGDSKHHWPTLGLNTLRWAKRQGAVCGPAHSANGLSNYVGRLDEHQDGPHGLPHFNIPAFDGIGANEYIVDVTHEIPGPNGSPVPAIDFISAMNTPRVDEWNMWYHSLNCGYRVRVSGETDFPCMTGERVGYGRVYVKIDGELNFADWVAGIQAGRSYVSDGSCHIIDFEARASDASSFLAVGENGSEIEVAGPSQIKCRAKCAAMIEDCDSVQVELVANGYPIATAEIKADGSLQEVEFDAEVDESSWLALRVFPHAHSNPFFVVVDNQPIRASRASAEWCLRCVEQCWREKQTTYALDEQQDAREAYEHARKVYESILAETKEP